MLPRIIRQIGVKAITERLQKEAQGFFVHPLEEQRRKTQYRLARQRLHEELGIPHTGTGYQQALAEDPEYFRRLMELHSKYLQWSPQASTAPGGVPSGSVPAASAVGIEAENAPRVLETVSQ